MNKHYFFTSKRLGFRKFRDADFELFSKMNSDPEVMRFFPSTRNQIEVRNLMQAINTHIDQHGFGYFAVDHLETNHFIGFIGLKKTSFQSFFTPCVEIGWRLDSSYWNQGYASEGAERCLEFAFSELGIKEIYSFTSLLNKPSERVMQKIGMNKINEFDHPLVEDNHPLKRHCLYYIKAKF